MNKIKKRIVVALGRNVLGSMLGEQITHVRATARIIADLVSEGHKIIIGHGNGPQVGTINSAMDYAAANGPCISYMPLPECGATSQGFIGYHLQQALWQSLLKRNLGKAVVSVATQVLVDKSDPALGNPTKSIGNFCTYEKVVKLEKEKGFVFVEDAGRDYRRVVLSPAPQRIVEPGVIRKMIQSGLPVATVGGGGIPVVGDDQGIHGIDAVADKDRSSSKLAQELKVDMLIILTAVGQVYIDYSQPDQRAFSEPTLREVDAHIKSGQFAKGSMLPRVEACMEFVRALPDRNTIIISLEKAAQALHGEAGTRTRSEPAPSSYVPLDTDSESYEADINQ